MWEEISYKGFCALGGLGGPKGHRLMTRPVYVGKHYHHTVYLYRR